MHFLNILLLATLALGQVRTYTDKFNVKVTQAHSEGYVDVWDAAVKVIGTQTPLSSPVLTGDVSTVTTYWTPDVQASTASNGSVIYKPNEMFRIETMMDNATLSPYPTNAPPTKNAPNGAGQVTIGVLMALPFVFMLFM